MVIKAKNVNQSSDLAIKATTNTEMIEDIFVIISRKKPTVVPPSSIPWAVKPVITKMVTNHAWGQQSFVPVTAECKGSNASQYVISMTLKVPGHQEFPEIL